MPAAVPTLDGPVGFLVGSKEAGEFQGNRFFSLQDFGDFPQLTGRVVLQVIYFHRHRRS